MVICARNCYCFPQEPQVSGDITRGVKPAWNLVQRGARTVPSLWQLRRGATCDSECGWPRILLPRGFLAMWPKPAFLLPSFLAARELIANAWVLPEARAIITWEGPTLVSECPCWPQDSAPSLRHQSHQHPLPVVTVTTPNGKIAFNRWENLGRFCLFACSDIYMCIYFIYIIFKYIYIVYLLVNNCFSFPFPYFCLEAPIFEDTIIWREGLFFHSRKVSIFLCRLFIWQILSLEDFKARQDSMLLFTAEVSLPSYSFSQGKPHFWFNYFYPDSAFYTLFPISVVSVRCDTAFVHLICRGKTKLNFSYILLH